jgi:hypothetical protein
MFSLTANLSLSLVRQVWTVGGVLVYTRTRLQAWHHRDLGLDVCMIGSGYDSRASQDNTSWLRPMLSHATRLNHGWVMGVPKRSSGIVRLEANALSHAHSFACRCKINQARICTIAHRRSETLHASCWSHHACRGARGMRWFISPSPDWPQSRESHCSALFTDIA